MTLLAFLLAASAPQDPPHSRDRSQPEEEAPYRTHFEIGPVFQYWLPRFRGDFQVDGTSKTGTRLDLKHDLGLPDDGAIPIYGGGAIGAWWRTAPSDHAEILLVAEYWGHSRAGFKSTTAPITLGDETFPSGSAVESRFHLSCLTLDATAALGNELLHGGITLSIEARSARLRMDSATVHANETIGDIYWGGGLFFEVRPIPFVMAGLSLKGFTSFGDATDTGAGEFRFYAGFRWKALTLEGGYRIDLYDQDLPDQHLSTTMHGPYVALNAIWRF